MGNTSSIRVHFPASYVSLQGCSLVLGIFKGLDYHDLPNLYHHLTSIKGLTHLPASFKNTPQKSSREIPVLFSPRFFLLWIVIAAVFFRPLGKFPPKPWGKFRQTPQFGEAVETHALILQFNDTNDRAHSQSVQFQLPKVHQHQDGTPHPKRYGPSAAHAFFGESYLGRVFKLPRGFSGLRFLEH